VRAVTEIADREEYAGLLKEALPHVIHGEAENRRFTAILESLLRKKKRPPAQNQLRELLTVLIEDFEQRAYALPQTGPVNSKTISRR
jgi:hypothetical protein